MSTPITSASSSRLATVPPFPPVAAELLRTLSDESVHLQEIASVIASDATLCARVLQYANSAEFALTDPIRNVRQALSMLGLDRTRKLTITIATAVYSGAALRAAELRRCWRHTIATAVLADEIAGRCGLFVESAYTAGMMHDIGRLGLLVAYPREYETTIREAAERCLDLLDFERETFGIDHAEAGRWLAERWRLPEEFRVIAGRHHDGCDGGPITLLRIVHVACRLADYFGYDVTRPLQAQPLAAVIVDLPQRVREAVMRDREAIRIAVETAIFSHDACATDDDPAAGGAEAVPITDAPPDEFMTDLALCCAPPPQPEPHDGMLARILRTIGALFTC
jgi:putative nucleotidyltransferase with HDIG domain